LIQDIRNTLKHGVRQTMDKLLRPEKAKGPDEIIELASNRVLFG